MFWLLWVIIVGLIAGWLAGKIMGTGGYGPVMDILLGIAGAIVGGFLLRLLGLYSAGGLISEIIVATIGAVFLIWLSRKLKKIKSFIVTFPSALLLCHSAAERRRRNLPRITAGLHLQFYLHPPCYRRFLRRVAASE